MEYLETHALRVYGSGKNTVTKTANELLKRIRLREIDEPFSIRDIYHSHHWSGLTNSEQVEEVVELLEEKGYLAGQKVKTNGRGTQRYWAHPKVMRHKTRFKRFKTRAFVPFEPCVFRELKKIGGKMKNQGGRPKKDIDPLMIEKLASIGCTGDEIAAVVGCCRDTLYARFSDTLKKGQYQAKASLRRMQWQAAVSGNVTMLIWLGKNLLGQTNKHEIESTSQQVFEIVHYGKGSALTWEEEH